MSHTFPAVLAASLKEELNLDNDTHQKVECIIKNMGEGICDVTEKELRNISAEKYWKPVIDAVSFLSITDLAIMAETFVNLESFRKKVTFTTETVGGPIDVAVITKGDGLIWIKRKHYFDKELNHAFFANYFPKILNED